MPGEQYVVVYEAPDGATYVYTTVYDDHEARRQLARCRWVHGNGCNARTFRAVRPARRGWEGTRV